MERILEKNLYMYIVESYCCTAEISTIIVNIEKTPQNCLTKQRKRAYKHYMTSLICEIEKTNKIEMNKPNM